MKDRVVEFPNRYRLVAVDGEDGVYDFVPVTGEITEAGTPLNKATLLSDETASLYGLDDSEAYVDNALAKAITLSSYMAFCTNANTDSLDAAFGKNNSDFIGNLGLQLAMYAWFAGSSKKVYPFTNLITKYSLSKILTNTSARKEVMANLELCKLIYASDYARTDGLGTFTDISFSGDTTKSTHTFNIKVTSKQISDGYLFFYGVGERSSGGINMTLSLNNVSLGTLSGGPNQTGDKTLAAHIKLANYNIKTAGTYTLTVVNNVANSSYPTSLIGGLFGLK